MRQAGFCYLLDDYFIIHSLEGITKRSFTGALLFHTYAFCRPLNSIQIGQKATEKAPTHQQQRLRG